MRDVIDKAIAKVQPYQTGLAIGGGVTFFAGLVVFGGMWALVIAAVCLGVGAALGTVVGTELGRRGAAKHIANLEQWYKGATQYATNLERENAASERRARDAEHTVLILTAEKRDLRAQLDRASTGTE